MAQKMAEEVTAPERESREGFEHKGKGPDLRGLA